MEEYQQETLIHNTPKIYSRREIETGTFLGGPFVAGYLLAHNFKVFGEPEKAKNSLIIGISFTVLLAVFLVLMPEGISDKIPNHLIPLFYTLIVYLIVRKYQVVKIDEHILAGAEKNSWWKVVGISLAGCIVLLLPAFIFVYLQEPANSGEVLKFGQLNHEIYYDISNVSVEQVRELGDKLTIIGIFTNKKTMHLKLSQTDSTYDIYFPVKDGAWSDSKASGYFRELWVVLQSSYPNRNVVLNLVSNNFDNVRMKFSKDTNTIQYKHK